MSETIINTKTIKCRAIGVKPIISDSPRLFFDIDNPSEEMKRTLVKYITNGNRISANEHKHWAVYKTHHGYHLVAETISWDRTRTELIALRNLTNSDYLSTDEIQFTYMLKYVPDTMRLRISGKWLFDGKVDGKKICNEPLLSNGCPCYTELRTGIKEVYDTYD